MLISAFNRLQSFNVQRSIFNDDHSVKYVTLVSLVLTCLFNHTSPLTAPPLLNSSDVGFKFHPTQLPHALPLSLERHLWATEWLVKSLVLVFLPPLLLRLKVNPHVPCIWRPSKHCFPRKQDGLTNMTSFKSSSSMRKGTSS
jgi:hypothetical protein